ncbi:alpha/beta hydrolase [Halomonas cerina]|uniref:Acetyl esterase/lipase n=1 Tax=Halomonas cerina TaxID=447424 RepID=A0A839V4K2_9GAMM|nr:alpha/beta hydrolase [Halomonas cerina]MBB3188908.1 acetyl esterase/lipase [Halomonas cerina]
MPISSPASGPQGLATVCDHLALLKSLTASSGNNLTVKRRLLDMYFAAAPEILDAHGRVTPVLIPTRGDRVIAAERVRPGDADGPPERRLLYLHGGSWIAGSPAGHRPLAVRLARATHAEVIVIDYRLAPEHPFPAGLEDCLDAWDWLCASHSDDDLLLAGDSAGGNLTLACLNVLKAKGQRLPDAAIAFSPATDLRWTGDSLRHQAALDPILDPAVLPLVTQAYLGPSPSAPPDDPRVSPLEGDLRGLPPLLLQCGEAEILLDDSRRYAEAAHRQGSPVRLSLWADMPHVFVGFAPLLEPASHALTEVGRFLDAQLAR